MSDKNDRVEEMIDAVNATSNQSRNMWLGFLGLQSYLLVTLASVTHKDLLLDSAVNLPIINVEMPLTSFFLFGPALLLLIHFGLLMQHVTLAQKLRAFNEAIAESVRTRAVMHKAAVDSHPTRSRLHGYSLTQYVAGPPSSWSVKFGQWLMSWLILSTLPLVMLLIFQAKFLPVHSLPLTQLHRVLSVIDLIMLFYLLVVIIKPAQSGPAVWPGKPVLSVLFFTIIMFTQMFVVSFVFTFPDERLERLILASNFWIVERSGRKVFAPTAYLFDGELDLVSGKSTTPFSRNLIVTDLDLVPDQKPEPNESSHSLRGRNLRYARFDRSDLHRVDLTGADLRHSSFLDTRLENAEMAGAKLQRATLVGAQLQRANFRSAKPIGKKLTLFKPKIADLGKAKLQFANLEKSNLQGTDFSDAELQETNMRFAKLQGAILNNTNLAGANLAGANLQGAKLHGANLRGANLSNANLEGAEIYTSDLRGADLTNANLRGAVLFFADLRGANLTRAKLWQTVITGPQLLRLAHFAGLELKVPDVKSIEVIKSGLDDIEDEELRSRVALDLAPILDAEKLRNWENSPTYLIWNGLKNRPSADSTKISTFLAQLACSDLAGHVANGFANRLLNSYFETRWTDKQRVVLQTYDRSLARALLKDDCQGADNIKKISRGYLKMIADGYSPKLPFRGN